MAAPHVQSPNDAAPHVHVNVAMAVRIGHTASPQARRPPPPALASATANRVATRKKNQAREKRWRLCKDVFLCLAIFALALLATGLDPGKIFGLVFNFKWKKEVQTNIRQKFDIDLPLQDELKVGAVTPLAGASSTTQHGAEVEENGGTLDANTVSEVAGKDYKNVESMAGIVSPELGVRIAQYAYVPRESDKAQITLSKHDIVRVFETTLEGWSLGAKLHPETMTQVGERGWFPSEFLFPRTTGQNEDATTSDDASDLTGSWFQEAAIGS